MFHGLKGPQSGRTSRTVAEQKGTDPAGFKEGPAYDAMAGHQVTAQLPAQEYKEAPMKAPAGGEAMSIPTPFTITK